MMDPSAELFEYHRLVLGLLGLPPEQTIDEQSLKNLFEKKIEQLRTNQAKLRQLLKQDNVIDVFALAEERLRKLQLQHELISNEHRRMITELEKKNDAMKELTQEAADRKQLKKEAQQLRAALEEAQTEVAKIKEENLTAAKKAEDMQFDLKRAQKKIHLLSDENKTLQSTKAALEAERDKNTAKIKTLTAEILDKNKKIEEQKKSIVGLERDVLERQTEIKMLNGTIEQRDVTIDQLKQSLAEKEEKYEKLEERKSKEIKSLNQQILLQQRKYETLKVNSDSRIHELEQEVQKLKNEFKKVAQDLTAQNTKKIKELSDEFDLKERKSREARNKEVAQTIARYEKNEKGVVDRYQRQIKDLTEDYETKINEHVAAFNKLTKERARTQEQLKHQTIVLKKDIEELTQKVAQRDGRIADLCDAKLAHENTIEQLHLTIAEQKQKMFETNEQTNQQIYYLNEEITTLKRTMVETSERDKKLLEQTVLQLTTEHEIVLDSIRGIMMEERETEMNDLKNKFVELQCNSEEVEQKLRYDLEQLTAKYNGIKDVYDRKHEEQEQRNTAYINSLNERHKYELEVQAELKEQEKVEVRNKYEMQIKAIEEQFAKERTSINSNFVEEKSSALTKQKNHYEAEIELLKRDMQLEARQKSNEFDRKYKTLERKLTDEQNAAKVLVKELEKLKSESKLKLESMTELHYRNEEESVKLRQQLEQLEIQKEQQREEFERCILRLETQIVQLREEYKKKEDYLLESCKKKIAVNLAEMKTFTDNLKHEMVLLEEKHNYRLELLNREYEQLQYLYQQRISKPEDIQALKIMHKAYLELELELQKERETTTDLKKQLANRQVANKLFSSRQMDSVLRVSGDAPFLRKKEK